LPDISLSIYPEEVDREFEEMRRLADSMHRGDELIIIPITGNARNDTPGHILRLVAPQSRAPFDSDMVAFRKKADAEIAAMEDWAKSKPATRTDIFGSLEVAERECRQRTATPTTLIIFSDFLEDDGLTDLRVEPALVSPERAPMYARQVRRSLEAAVLISNVSMVQLRSKDATNMSPARMRAVESFWKELLKLEGDATPDKNPTSEP